MAGNDGTYAYTSGPATFNLQFSGMAPGAYVMSYRLDGDIGGVHRRDRGRRRRPGRRAQHQPRPQPLADRPTRRTTRSARRSTPPWTRASIVAASSGNAGANGDTSITGSWKLSPKVITVANSSHARVFSNAVTVAGPGTVPADAEGPRGRPRRRADASDRHADHGRVRRRAGRRRRQRRPRLRPASGRRASPARSCWPRAASARSTSRRQRMAAGALAYIVHNNGARRPDLDGRHHGTCDPGRDGHARGRQGARRLGGRERGRDGDVEGPLARLTSGWPDVVAASSSRGPALTMAIKPDIAAPGSSVLSSIVERRDGRRRPGDALRPGQRHVDGDAAHHRPRGADGRSIRRGRPRRSRAR